MSDGFNASSEDKTQSSLTTRRRSAQRRASSDVQRNRSHLIHLLESSHQLVQPQRLDDLPEDDQPTTSKEQKPYMSLANALVHKWTLESEKTPFTSAIEILCSLENRSHVSLAVWTDLCQH